MVPWNKGSHKADCDKVPTEAEVERLLAMADADQRPIGCRNALILRTFANTGLRGFELAGLRVSDVMLNRHLLKVRCGKRGYSREVYYNGQLKELLASWVKGRDGNEPLFRAQHGSHLTTTALREVFKLYARQAGLPPIYSLHCLRHFYGTQAYRETGNLLFVARQLGHHSLDMVMWYAHLVDQASLAAGMTMV